MSSATLRCNAYFESILPATLPRQEPKVAESGVYRVASRKGFDAKNVLASLRVNIEFVRAMTSNGSPLLAEALEEIEAATARLDHIVAELAG
jgi:hypothetical protein